MVTKILKIYAFFVNSQLNSKFRLINKFAVSKMDIETFSQMHSIQPEALRSWIQEKMYRSQHPESELPDKFQAFEFVELDIPHASKHQITG